MMQLKDLAELLDLLEELYQQEVEERERDSMLAEESISEAVKESFEQDVKTHGVRAGRIRYFIRLLGEGQVILK